MQRDKIKALILDVDGVLTDGSIIYSSKGIEYKKFYVKDGSALQRVKKKGLSLGIITGRDSSIVEMRAKELSFDFVYQGVKNKVEIYEKIKEKYGFTDSEVAYMGDDYPDLELLRAVGFSGCPSDSVKSVLEESDFVSSFPGGRGCVMDFIDQIVEKNGD